MADATAYFLRSRDAKPAYHKIVYTWTMEMVHALTLTLETLRGLCRACHRRGNLHVRHILSLISRLLARGSAQRPSLEPTTAMGGRVSCVPRVALAGRRAQTRAQSIPTVGASHPCETSRAPTTTTATGDCVRDGLLGLASHAYTLASPHACRPRHSRWP